MLDFFINERRMTLPLFLQSKQEQANEDYYEQAAGWPISYDIFETVAILRISGSLASEDIPYWYFYGDTSYESIVAAIDELIANPRVDTIILSFNSPGGTVTGCAEAAAAIRARTEKIEIFSFCRMADSAAYWLASATEKIYIDPTGEVGSIGVIMTHADWSKALDDFGLKITHIHAGSHKADGSPYAALSDSAKARFQEDVEQLRDVFATNVADNRGMTLDVVKETEALTFIGKKAMDSGLADEVAFLPDMISTLTGSAVTELTIINAKENDMARKMVKKSEAKPAKTSKKAEEEGQDEKVLDSETEAEESADAEEDTSSESDEEVQENSGGTDARSAERSRISSILNCEEAKGRQSLANHIAMNTDMDLNQAKDMLNASTKQDVKKENPLSSAMKSAGNPEIGVDGKSSDKKSGLLKTAERMSSKK